MKIFIFVIFALLAVVFGKPLDGKDTEIINNETVFYVIFQQIFQTDLLLIFARNNLLVSTLSKTTSNFSMAQEVVRRSVFRRSVQPLALDQGDTLDQCVL